MPNLNELIDLREWARDQDKLRQAGLPSEWDQGVWLATHLDEEEWSCGSACCIAGKVVLNIGAQPIWDDRGYTGVVRFEDTVHRVSYLAEQILGITWHQAYELFSENNRFSEIEYIIDAIIANPEWDGRFDTEFQKIKEC